jgi:hypothetical protein
MVNKNVCFSPREFLFAGAGGLRNCCRQTCRFDTMITQTTAFFQCFHSKERKNHKNRAGEQMF